MPVHTPNEWPLRILSETAGMEVGVHIRLGVVVCRYCMMFSTFLMALKPLARAVLIIVFDAHRDDRADTGKCINHDANERSIPTEAHN
jgi:hypothetical protein